MLQTRTLQSYLFYERMGLAFCKNVGSPDFRRCFFGHYFSSADMSGDDNDDSSDGIGKSSSDEEETTAFHTSLLDKSSKREAAINGAHQASSLSDHSASEKDAD